MVRKSIIIFITLAFFVVFSPTGVFLKVTSADTFTHQSVAPEGYIGIYTVDDLNNIRNNLDGHYILMNDIDLSTATADGGSYYNGGAGWTPIGDETTPFTGILDGNGHTISGLRINITSSTSGVNAGLFGYNNGIIQNLSMTNSDIHAKSDSYANVGGITGVNEYGTISNCYNTGDVNGGGNGYVGGIAGFNSSGTISNCYNTGNVYGGYSSGIAGYNSNGTISNCYNTGNVDGGYTGGIVGVNNNTGTISNCYNTGNVSGNYIGGIVGSNSGTISNCYNTGNIYGYGGRTGGIAAYNTGGTISNCYVLGSGGGTSLSLDQMKTQSSYNGFDFADTWNMSAGYLPYLKSIPYVQLSSMSFGSSNVSLGTNGTYQLSLVYSPANPTFTDVSYTSLDSSIASVDANGLITGLKVGTTSIIAKDTLTNKTAVCTVNVAQGVNGIYIQGNNSVNVGGSVQLEATVTPSNVGNKIVNWSSSDNSIATVDQNGLVTSHLGGNVTITAASTDGTNVRNSFTLTVVRNAQSISLDNSSVQLKTGETKTLVATISPLDTTNKNVIWSSSNPDAVVVDSNGQITAKSKGTAVITAKTEDGGFTATCNVTVFQPVNGVSFSQSTYNLGLGYQWKLVPTISPSNANNQNVSWDSSDPSVTVGSDGTITGASVGTSVITVTTKDGGYEAMCIVNVGTAVTNISINKTQLSLIEGQADTLSIVSVLPKDAINQSVTWQSSNTSVATVDANGNVKTIAPGIATITATSADGSGVTANCSVTVSARALTGITMSGQPTKTSYIQGQNLDVTGSKIQATYNDDSTQTVNVTSDMVSGYNPNQVGTQTVTVTYKGQITTFTVNVRAKMVTNITMSSQPTKTIYIQGQSLDVTGAKIKATYNNGSTQLVDVTPGMVSGYNTNRVGAQTITVTYNGQTTSFVVSVQAKTFTVSFNKNDGSRTTPQTVTAGTKVQIPSSPTRTGYSFAGWYTAALGGTKILFPYTVNGNVTFYAHWTVFAKVIPAGVSASAKNYNTVTVKWNAVPGATGYKVYRATSAKGVYTSVTITTAAAYTNSGLNTGTTYYYKVLAYQTSGKTKTNTNYSAVVSAKPVLSKIGKITVKTASTNSMKVTWGAVSGASGYTVYYSTSSNGKYTAVNTTSLSSTVSKLVKGKIYYFKVAAYRKVGTAIRYGGTSAIVSLKM